MNESQKRLDLAVRKKEVEYKLNKGDGNMLITNQNMEMRKILEKKENRSFFNTIILSGKTGDLFAELEVPTDIELRIKEKLELYSALYGEVQKATIGVEGRVNILTGDPIAKWNIPSGTIEELIGKVEDLEMEDIKLSGFFTLSNCVLTDSDIQMALLIEDTLVKGIANGLDDGIINGSGDYTVVFEPVGILMDLPPENIVSGLFDKTITQNISLIDNGQSDIGEVIAIMKRKTYYSNMDELSLTSLPYPNINGLRVKFSRAIDEDTIIFGDFNEYVLGERSGFYINHSDHVKFIDDVRTYKIVGRYDGKPINKSAFVKVTKASE